MSERAAPLDRLRARIARLGAPLCLGIDPHPDALPDDLSRDVAGIEMFARGLLEAAAEHAAAVKVNVAFFEAFGSAGWAALERVVGDVPDDHFLLLDAKRGDIGSTAERYAAGLLGRLGADAVTLSPYLGEDAVEPFLAYPGRVVFIVVRTSNPSAGRLQDLPVGGMPLHERVASWAAATWPDGRVGLVVGATAPAELLRLRQLAPGPGFLVPGVGAQGGDLATALATCHGTAAPGIVTISRGIAATSRGETWRAVAAESAREWLG
ncbi:MAG: orotidine-5'-phosphate decarboxylase, partial [Candidatus Limnocylindria bacterium]